MLALLGKEIRHNPLLWLLVFVPAVFAGAPSRWRRRRATRSGAC